MCNFTKCKGVFLASCFCGHTLNTNDATLEEFAGVYELVSQRIMDLRRHQDAFSPVEDPRCWDAATHTGLNLHAQVTGHFLLALQSWPTAVDLVTDTHTHTRKDDPHFPSDSDTPSAREHELSPLRPTQSRPPPTTTTSSTPTSTRPPPHCSFYRHGSRRAGASLDKQNNFCALLDTENSKRVCVCVCGFAGTVIASPHCRPSVQNVKKFTDSRRNTNAFCIWYGRKWCQISVLFVLL